MKNGNPRSPGDVHNVEGFATALRGLVDEWRPLFDALVGLRTDGPAACEGRGPDLYDAALEALLALPILRRVKANWELWDLLVMSDGLNPDSLLNEYIAHDVIDVARTALWGDGLY